MPSHSHVALVFLGLVNCAHSFNLSTCTQDAIWVTYPVPRDALLAWIQEQVGEKDMSKLSLETPEEYGDHHPMQIEFDTNTKCSSLKFVPYPDFQEIVVQIPYVRFQGKLVRFQPWALVDNFGGAMAMLLLGSRNQEAKPFTVSYGPAPAMWSQMAQVAGNVTFQVKDVPVDNFQPHAVLQQKDKVWQELMDTKMATFVAKPHPWVGYACSQIAYNLAATQVTRISNGTINIAGNGKFSPIDIHTSMKTLQAYAVRTQFTVKMSGCPSKMSDATEGNASFSDMLIV